MALAPRIVADELAPAHDIQRTVLAARDPVTGAATMDEPNRCKSNCVQLATPETDAAVDMSAKSWTINVYKVGFKAIASTSADAAFDIPGPAALIAAGYQIGDVISFRGSYQSSHSDPTFLINFQAGTGTYYGEGANAASKAGIANGPIAILCTVQITSATTATLWVFPSFLRKIGV